MRYRLQQRVIPELRRTVDIVFSSARVAVDVRGCFWHGCPAHASHPKSNAEWWRAKIDRNRSRDAETERALQACGWQVIVVWEHDDVAEAADLVVSAVREGGR